MKKPDNPKVSSRLSMNTLADVAAVEYGATEADNSDFWDYYYSQVLRESTEADENSKRKSIDDSKLMMLANVAIAMSEYEILKDTVEENSRISLDVPIKETKSSSMATQRTRVIEKQRSVERNPNNPESSSSYFTEPKKKTLVSNKEEEERILKKRKTSHCYEVGSSSGSQNEKRKRSVTSAELEEALRMLTNPKPDLESSPSACVTINASNEKEEKSRKKLKIVIRRPRLEVVPAPTSTPPEWLVNVMMREDNAHDPKLIIKRKLYKSDLDRVQARLSMPLKQVVNSDFLTAEETRIIHEQSVLKSRKEGVSVVLVDPLLNKHVVELRKWNMSGGWNYVFVNGWNDVVARNNFNVEDVIHVWSFRSGEGKLCFALLPLLPQNSAPPENSGQDGPTSGESGHGSPPP